MTRLDAATAVETNDVGFPHGKATCRMVVEDAVMELPDVKCSVEMAGRLCDGLQDGAVHYGILAGSADV